jgi:putative ABC transport system permease protein
MSVVIKALMKSLVEKKARTFLVLFSIAVSAALIFANETFARTVAQRFYEADVRWSGVSDLTIETKKIVGAKEWIDTERLAKYSDSFEYAFQFIKEKALYMPSLEQMHYFTIIGADIEEFNRHNPVTLAQGDFQEWNGFKIIIGKTYANEYQLKVNDMMKLELNNAEYEFKVVGISEVKGLFLREFADGGFMLAPKATLSQIFNGDCNLLFMKLKDRSQREVVKDQLTADFADYEVRYGINDAVIAAETQNHVLPFQVASIVVVFMCMFIIFTAFNVITLERIPIVGTLRSIGCTRKKINAILIVESACLGAIGGLFGCLLGVLVLQYIKSLVFAGEEAVINTTVLFGGREVVIAVGAAVLITTASAVLPILRLTKTPIKNIILNDLGKKAGKKTRFWVAGLLLMVACIFVPQFLGSNFTGMIIASALATGAVVGLVPLVPFLTDQISRLVGKIPFLSQDVALGIRNIRDNPSLMNNIQLFSAAIAIIAFMASMFNTMGADLLKAFVRDWKYDISLVLRHSDLNTMAELTRIEGVEAATGGYLSHTSILNHGTFLNALFGIEGKEFFEFNVAGDLENNQQALETLNQGKHIITTNVLKGKLGLEEGDTLLLQFGSKEVAYTITGFVETNLGIGHAGYISADNYRADMGVADYDFIYVKAPGNADQAKNNILRALSKEVMRIDTKQELTAANADKVIGIFKAISTYCYLALVVGIIGIVNNLVASFIERKRSFAMYRCVGMSKKGLNRMLITEAVAMGVLGVGFGISCALIMSSAIPTAVSVMWGKVTVQLAVKEMAIIGSVGILAMLAISAVPVVRSEKMSLIETIKYE